MQADYIGETNIHLKWRTLTRFEQHHRYKNKSSGSLRKIWPGKLSNEQGAGILHINTTIYGMEKYFLCTWFNIQ